MQRSSADDDKYSEIGGAWALFWHRFLPGMTATWPFAKLTVTREAISLRLLWKLYVFRTADIVQIRGLSFLFQRGIRIVHTVREYPRFVLFWTFSYWRLTEELRERGFSVWERGRTVFD